MTNGEDWALWINYDDVNVSKYRYGSEWNWDSIDNNDIVFGAEFD
jgi:hypothetical protein